MSVENMSHDPINQEHQVKSIKEHLFKIDGFKVYGNIDVFQHFTQIWNGERYIPKEHPKRVELVIYVDKSISDKMFNRFTSPQPIPIESEHLDFKFINIRSYTIEGVDENKKLSMECWSE